MFAGMMDYKGVRGGDAYKHRGLWYEVAACDRMDTDRNAGVSSGWYRLELVKGPTIEVSGFFDRELHMRENLVGNEVWSLR